MKITKILTLPEQNIKENGRVCVFYYGFGEVLGRGFEASIEVDDKVIYETGIYQDCVRSHQNNLSARTRVVGEESSNVKNFLNLFVFIEGLHLQGVWTAHRRMWGYKLLYYSLGVLFSGALTSR